VSAVDSRSKLPRDPATPITPLSGLQMNRTQATKFLAACDHMGFKTVRINRRPVHALLLDVPIVLPRSIPEPPVRGAISKGSSMCRKTGHHVRPLSLEPGAVSAAERPVIKCTMSGSCRHRPAARSKVSVSRIPPRGNGWHPGDTPFPWIRHRRRKRGQKPSAPTPSLAAVLPQRTSDRGFAKRTPKAKYEPSHESCRGQSQLLQNTNLAAAQPPYCDKPFGGTVPNIFH